MIKKILLLLLLVLCGIFPDLHAQEIRITSTLDKRTVNINQEIHLTIRIEGASGNVQAPRLPDYKGFDTFYTGRSSHMTFINGRSSARIEFSYVLVAKEVGEFVLDPIEMTVSGRQFRTDPVQVEVRSTGLGTTPGSSALPYRPSARATARSSSSSQPSYRSPPVNFVPSDENIFVKAWIDKTSVYPNEQVLLTYSLYTRYDTRYEGFDEEPEVSGFWIEEFPAEREIRRETVRINGKRYVKAEIKKMALFPTAAADYTIQPGTLKVSIRQEPQSTSVFDEFFNDSFFSGGNFFARRENRLLKPPPIALIVKDFPARNKPSSFEGAVGNFRLSAALDKRELRQNEPVTMTLVIEGEGNIETLNKPTLPDLPKFKVYESDTTSQLYKSGHVIGGRKTFEIVFIPIEAGTLILPAMPFSFFDPSHASYRTLMTPEFVLEVEPSKEKFELPRALTQQAVFKKDVQIEERDIHYIHERLSSGRPEQVMKSVFLGLAGADVLLILLVLSGLLRHRQEEIFAKDTGLKRRRLAKSQAQSKLRELKRLSRARGDEEAAVYFEEIEKILTQYLSDKFNLSAYGITRTDLENELEKALGSEDELYGSIVELFRLCDESRFAKAQIPQEKKDSALKILKATLSRVEKMR